MERNRFVPSTPGVEAHVHPAETSPVTAPEASRPRVTGAREEEILDACVGELLENGYDRLTMDAVAKRARASKATLYRRWQSKQSLVVDAVIRSKRMDERALPDTGSLRGDLLDVWSRGKGDVDGSRVLGVVITAMQTDEEFAADFRARFLGPKVATSVEIYRRAAERGELHPDADPSLLGPAMAGILLHRALVLGESVTPERVERVLDQIILPAAIGRPSAARPPARATPHDLTETRTPQETP
jgi:AcrR family transcriptional regulator